MGALDGCHIDVCARKENSTDYPNYKGWHSVIILAVVYHTYTFLYANVGSSGRNHDASVFHRSRLPKVLAGSRCWLEAGSQKIKGSLRMCALALFSLPTRLSLCNQPYRNLTHTLALVVHRRRCSTTVCQVPDIWTNAFGRLKARFRVLYHLECDNDNVNRIMRACCVLHNICEQLSDRWDVTWVDAVVH